MLGRRLGIGPLVLPGAVWLASSSSFRSRSSRRSASGPTTGSGGSCSTCSRSTTTARRSRRRSSRRSRGRVYYAGMTTILSIAIGYPVAYWISRYGGRNKALLLILVMLPFWTSYLIRTYAWMIILRDNGVVNSILHGLGLTTEPVILLNTDLAVILGHDLRVPAVRDPAPVRVDRPARRAARAGRARPLRERPGRLHPRHPAADHAGHHRRGAAHVHPGDRRLRDAGPARRRRRRRRSPRWSRRCSCRAATGRRARRSGSSSWRSRSSARFVAIRSLRTEVLADAHRRGTAG